MCGDIDRKYVKDDVKTAVRVEIERAYQAHDTLPSRFRPLLDFFKALDRSCCRGIVWGAEITNEIRCQLRISFGLLA